MVTNYIALARENREKALDGLKHNRGQILAISDCAVYRKHSRRLPAAVFISSRNAGSFAQANLL